jgi:uncharacterized protein (DUF305 family)
MRLALGLCLALTLPLPLAAQTADEKAAYADALTDINSRMHAAMSLAPTGDADVDFVRGMIPHHQAAVDMALLVLEYGEDPDVRQLAEAVIAAQEAEIAWMTLWLEQNAP